MEIVVISAYSQGYYSKSEYTEEVVIPKATYEKVKEDIEEIDMYVYGLDGKHSQNEVDIEIDILENESEIVGYGIEGCSKDSLYCELEVILKKQNIDIESEITKVEDYLETLDKLISIEVTIRESQKEQVMEYIKQLSK